MERVDRYLGCLYGIAIGDALGAPVEFTSLEAIRAKHGFDGITDMVRRYYTDDTQMSLATANALIDVAEVKDQLDRYDPTVFAYRRYQRWFRSQSDPSQRRGPGGTCLGALSSGKMGTIGHPINDSKGNGGAMRTAPVGLAFAPGTAFRFGAEFAATTHGHPSGFLPAGFMAEMISHLSEGADLGEAITEAKSVLVTWNGFEETLGKVDEAIAMTQSTLPAFAAVEKIGAGHGGGTGEEALGITLYCSLRFRDGWKAGVLAAVNHSGDSDSTGSMTGAVLGTLLGVARIPPTWVRKVEDSAEIRDLALKLYRLYGASKITPRAKRGGAGLFPRDIGCPICGHLLKVPRAGKFKCGRCRQLFELRDDGTFLL